MNIKNLTRKIRVAGVAFFLLFGIGIFSATAANAQNDRRDDNNRRNDRRDDDRRDNNRRDDDRYDNDRDDDDRYDNDRDYNRNNRNNSVMQQAYRIGFSEGVEDARSGRRPNAQRAAGQAMRQMNNGNNSRWGNQRNFRQQYREAFIRGYQEGFNRYDRNDRRNNNRNRRNGY